MKRYIYYLLPIACCLFFTACKKDSFITSSFASVYISTDSLKYDTVFTTTGSITKSFMIFNNNNQKLRLDKVKLMGGAASAYKMNVDGTFSNEVNDIEIEANDSIYVFVSVTIDPSSSTLPFIVSDSILVNYNGNSRFVQLQSYGQNANFLSNTVITGNVTWTNTLPYVIVGRLRIDTLASLTINPGCKIYAHANAPIIVDGTLLVNGTKANSVIFTGDRLDVNYKDLPASWPGIYFRGSSKDNVLTYAEVKNAYQAVVVEQPAITLNPKVTLHQCSIDNAYDAGMLCINTRVEADNTLISNCGNNIVLTYGGDYTLTNCTVAGMSTLYITHKNPVLITNNFTVQNNTLVTNALNAVFTNCIFWGDVGLVEDEVIVNKQGSNPFTVLFQNNIYRAANDPINSTLTNNIKNQNPSFDSVDVSNRYFDFRITKNSVAPGINAGIPTAFLNDLDDLNRNNGLTDLGCYEKQ